MQVRHVWRVCKSFYKRTHCSKYGIHFRKNITKILPFCNIPLMSNREKLFFRSLEIFLLLPKARLLYGLNFFFVTRHSFFLYHFLVKTPYLSLAGVERANTYLPKVGLNNVISGKNNLSLYLSRLIGNRRDASFLCHKSNMCAFGQLSRVSCDPSTTLIHTLWKRKGPQVTLKREWSKMTFWAKIIYSKCFQGTRSIVFIVLVAKYW